MENVIHLLEIMMIQSRQYMGLNKFELVSYYYNITGGLLSHITCN